MIIVQLSGDLGNQMFQYAFGRRLALIHQTDLKLDISAFEAAPENYTLDGFNIRAGVAEQKDIRQLVNLHFLRGAIPDDIDRANFPVRTDVKEKPYLVTLHDNTYITGNCWTLHYFQAIASELRKELQVKEPPHGQNKKLLARIERQDSVSLYIRRQTPSDTALCEISPDYYYRAAQYLADHLKHPVFYIFSDDISWCKQNFFVNFPHYYIGHNDSAHFCEDFRLMNRCRHHIIPNAPLCWWTAWLHESRRKIVVAPKQWLTDGGEDFVPQKWFAL